MTDTNLLKSKIDEKGYKLKFIASELGLSYYGLKLKIDNLSQFKSGEIKKLCELLEIESLKEKESIFFKL